MKHHGLSDRCCLSSLVRRARTDLKYPRPVPVKQWESQSQQGSPSLGTSLSGHIWGDSSDSAGSLPKARGAQARV